jgi:ribonuclease HI
MGRSEEEFVRSLIDGLTWKDSAAESGLSPEKAKAFLESIARFAGSVNADIEFRASSGTSKDAGVNRHKELVVHTDGASLGNPGPSGAGAVVTTPDGAEVASVREHLGHATNNRAEYEAVRLGLETALAHGARRVTLRMDSELVARQLTGRYKVRNRGLVDAFFEVKALIAKFDDVRIESIPREQNSEADKLAKMGAKDTRKNR